MIQVEPRETSREETLQSLHLESPQLTRRRGGQRRAARQRLQEEQSGGKENRKIILQVPGFETTRSGERISPLGSSHLFNKHHFNTQRKPWRGTEKGEEGGKPKGLEDIPGIFSKLEGARGRNKQV